MIVSRRRLVHASGFGRTAIDLRQEGSCRCKPCEPSGAAKLSEGFLKTLIGLDESSAFSVTVHRYVEKVDLFLFRGIKEIGPDGDISEGFYVIGLKITPGRFFVVFKPQETDFYGDFVGLDGEMPDHIGFNEFLVDRFIAR